MPVLASVAATVFAATLNTVAPADTISVATLQAEYSSIIELQERSVGGNTFTTVNLRRDAAESPYLGSFVAANNFPLVYLITYGPSFDQAAIFNADRSLDARSADYFAALREDSEFNAVLLPMVTRHLAGRGIIVTGVALPPKESEPFERLRNIAVRFFYPDAVDGEGRVRGHVCAGINGLLDIEGGRDLELEALAFGSIVRNISTTQAPNLITEFGEVMEQISGMPLSTAPETKVIRAQGVMWLAMAESNQLENVLRQGFDDWGPVFGFTLD